MRIEEIYRWLCYQIRKPILKVIYGKRIKLGKKGKVNPSASIRLIDEKSKMSIGDRVSVRPCSEVFAVESGKLEIGNDVFINRGVIIGAANSVVLGDGVTIGPNTCIYDHNHSKNGGNGFDSEPIIIEDKVWIGANVSILKGVTIGKNSVVGAGAVVTKDVPANSIYVGVPQSKVFLKSAE